jgi:hypothetical protein
MWIRDVLTMGVVRARECKVLPVGAFVECELYLSWMQFFPSPFMPFILLILLLFLQEANQGTLPWRGDQWWQCYPQVLVNVYAIIIVLCISIDNNNIRTRSLRNTHSQETQHLSWETL